MFVRFCLGDVICGQVLGFPDPGINFLPFLSCFVPRTDERGRSVHSHSGEATTNAFFWTKSPGPSQTGLAGQQLLAVLSLVVESGAARAPLLESDDGDRAPLLESDDGETKPRRCKLPS